MYICTHCHFRDWKEAAKETVSRGLKVAELAGMTAVVAVGNTDPPILDADGARAYLKLSEDSKSPVKMGVWVCITPNPDQIKEAVRAYNEEPRVVGIKMFAGPSTGDLTIKEPDQRWVYWVLREQGYKGPLMTHAEDELLFRLEMWNPARPMTHALSRPWQAEVSSVQKQIRFADEAKFDGLLYFAHISTPEAVNIIHRARSHRRIACGATPHHMTFDCYRMNAPDGLLYKMTPPLRPVGMQDEMAGQFCDGLIDWLETDHAPHELEKKAGPPYASGIPGLFYYPHFVKRMHAWRMPQERIHNVTYANASRLLDLEQRLGFKARQAEVKWGELQKIAVTYPFNPYKALMCAIP
ncbi:hypothetical protein HY642_06905 [Candidatus Woesearchaeota archaeon]|nr:hypothetical protein [Candidatus Woesearchaeota archaeon]